MRLPVRAFLFAFCFFALAPMPARAQTLVRCTSVTDFNALGPWYCEENHCKRCRAVFSSIVEIFDGQDSRHMWHSNGGCTNFPDGWAEGCYELDVRGDYLLTFTMSYEHTSAGAQFRVWFDGQVLGTTPQRGMAWGWPCTDTFGAPLGAFSIHVCGGIHRVEVQEITMALFPYFWAGPSNMIAISYGMDLDATRWTGSPQQLAEERVADVPTLSATSYPNPGSAMQRIAFRVPKGASSPTSVEVFNVRGTKIRTLSVASATGPEQSVDWNGRDDRGLIVPNGVYFYRVQQGAAAFTGRIVRSTGPSGPEGSVAPALSASSVLNTAPVPTSAGRKSPGRTPPGLRPDGLYDEGGGGGGGTGNGTPGDRSIMQTLEAASPFVTIDTQGEPSLNAQDAIEIGHMVQEEIELIQKIIEWKRAIDEAKNAGSDWSTDGTMCWLILSAQKANRIPTYPCLDFDNPPPVPGYQCNGPYFPTEQAARDSLISLGYHPTNFASFYGRVGAVPREDDFTKPVTGAGCPTAGAYRYNARVVGCGCNWTFYQTAFPEPNPEVDSYPHSQWWYNALVAWWHICYAPAHRQPPSCCQG
jgi:hypothetical protein